DGRRDPPERSNLARRRSGPDGRGRLWHARTSAARAGRGGAARGRAPALVTVKLITLGSDVVTPPCPPAERRRAVGRPSSVILVTPRRPERVPRRHGPGRRRRRR